MAHIGVETIGSYWVVWVYSKIFAHVLFMLVRHQNPFTDLFTAPPRTDPSTPRDTRTVPQFDKHRSSAGVSTSSGATVPVAHHLLRSSSPKVQLISTHLHSTIPHLPTFSTMPPLVHSHRPTVTEWGTDITMNVHLINAVLFLSLCVMSVSVSYKLRDVFISFWII